MIKITYDKSADAAYILLDTSLDQKQGWSKRVVTVNPLEIDGMINLDFDEHGVLGGIEIIDASKKIPKSVIDNAHIIG
jgi:uncharacterized protein YuzE